MRLLGYFCVLLVFTGTLVSCNRVKNKAKWLVHKVTNKAKTEIKDQSKKIAEKVFPPFDHDQPDTENNKKRFDDFLKVERTSDVKNIYCFDDAIGIDADYMFSFNCSEETSNKIIKTHQLKIETTNTDNAFGLQDEFDWWNKERIKQLQKYSWTDGDQYHKYYWYDAENEQAYFFDFTL